MASYDDSDFVTVSYTEKPSVLVLGHSFVARLGDDVLSDHKLKPDFDLRHVHVRCMGLRGGNIFTLLDDDKHRLDIELKTNHPILVVSKIGENDIDCRGFDEEIYKSSVRHFIFQLQTLYQVEKIALCEIFPRLRTRSVSVDNYHAVKDRINRDLMVHYSVDNPTSNVVFWFHRGGITTTADYFCHDKVHLNKEGTYKFYHSIRRVINYCYPE